MAVSKRLRYEVLRRDNFTCRYCGASAPDVPITVDHVVPKALGGKDEPSNLVAACGDCNGGKTSSSPDSPVVAGVAEDALRWSRAMQIAAGEMLASASENVDAREHFAKAWARYGTGPQRTPLPKDPNWRQTVDSLLCAGLPPSSLEECIDIAMNRRVAEENVFRYMCGVAWRKVSELQERARQISKDTPVGDSAGDLDAVRDEAIDNWCRTILKQREPRDLRVATRDCLERAGDESPSGVLWFIIYNLEMDRAVLRDGLLDLMRALPGGIGEQLIQQYEAYCLQHFGPDYNPASALFTASQYAVDDVALARARQEMADMPGDERDAWVQRAREDNADIAEHLSESWIVTEAARFAREAREAVALEAS